MLLYCITFLFTMLHHDTNHALLYHICFYNAPTYSYHLSSKMLHFTTFLFSMLHFTTYFLRCSTLQRFFFPCSTLPHIFSDTTLNHLSSQIIFFTTFIFTILLRCSSLPHFFLQCSTLTHTGILRGFTLPHIYLPCSTLPHIFYDALVYLVYVNQATNFYLLRCSSLPRF